MNLRWLGIAGLALLVALLAGRALLERGPILVLGVSGGAGEIAETVAILEARQGMLAMPPRAEHDAAAGTIELALSGPVPPEQAAGVLARPGSVAIHASAGDGVGGDCSDGVPEGAICLTHAAEDTTPVALVAEPELSGDLVEAVSVIDVGGAPLVRLVLNAEARAALARFSAGQIGRVIALVVDDVIVTAPIVSAPIETGELSFSVASPEIARDLRVLLSHPPLPVEILDADLDLNE